MFNGIIEEVGVVTSVKNIGGAKELVISTTLAPSLEVDNSLCVNGVCQTIVRKDQHSVAVQAIEETMRKTTLGDLRSGDGVNLEQSLSPSQRIDGHIVQGHVDTTGVLKDIRQEGTNWLCTIGYDAEWRDLVVGRGSIAIDGISLTIAREVEGSFTVAIIPYTWEHTVIKKRKKGDRVNLEFDILGKYVVRFMQNREAGSVPAASGSLSDATDSRNVAGMEKSPDQSAEGSKSGPSADAGGVSRKLLRDSGFLS